MSENTTTDRYAPSPEQLERVKSALVGKHEGDEIFYTNCAQNGCFDSCVIRAHVRDGKCVAVETDDLLHPNTGREDEYMEPGDLEAGLWQKRACTRGRGLRRDCYFPNRILYPMKRVGPRGTLEFERISWDEALDLFASKYLETREKYGKLSVFGDGMLEDSFDPWSAYLPGGGIQCWGEDSYEPTNFADTFVYGEGVDLKAFYGGRAVGNVENQSFLDAKLILLFGYDPAINYTEVIYYMLMAKERGIPIIVVDPRLTWTAQTIATQYIPIRPNTDLPFIMAMAQVMFEEDLIDHEFIDKWVEPTGLEKWRRYVMGEEYGEEPKTPEWAASICGVPAETIRELARLYAASRPCFLRMVWAVGRKIYGKDTTRALNYLTALGGNVGKKGTAGTGVGHGNGGACMRKTPFLYLGDQPKPYENTTCIEAEKWATAVLEHERLEKGEITEAEYKAAIGCPSNAEAPNIKMIHLMNMVRTYPTGWYDSNERIEALKKVDFFAIGAWNWDNPNVRYADLVLPYAHQFLEGPRWTPGQTNAGFAGGGGGTKNMMMYQNGGCEPQGESRHPILVMKQIADRLGIGDQFMPFLNGVSQEDFPKAIDTIAGKAYNAWAADPTVQEKYGEIESWSDFKKHPVIRWKMDDYWVWKEKDMAEGKPFGTPSGKIEFYSDFLANADLKKAVHKTGAKTFGGSGHIPPMAIYRESPVGPFSAKTKDYPLYLVTPHSFYRHHTGMDHNLWFRDEHRNSVWMSPVDAKARGIKDGDMVRVYSEAGEIMVPAYVTSRMTPSTICVIFGRWQEPTGVKTDLSPNGLDTRGNCNLLIKDNFYDDVLGALLCSDLCQIEKIQPAGPVKVPADLKEVG